MCSFYFIYNSVVVVLICEVPLTNSGLPYPRFPQKTFILALQLRRLLVTYLDYATLGYGRSPSSLEPLASVKHPSSLEPPFSGSVPIFSRITNASLWHRWPSIHSWFTDRLLPTMQIHWSDEQYSSNSAKVCYGLHDISLPTGMLHPMLVERTLTFVCLQTRTKKLSAQNLFVD